MKTQNPQTRRRSKRAHEAIVAATRDLLDKKGYYALSIEGIATRAGVGKQTIYRWWPSKAALVIEAYCELYTSQIHPPDTGSLSLDLEQWLVSIFKRISTAPTARIMSGLISEAQADPAIAEHFYTGFIKGRRELMIRLLEKGIARGEIRPDTDLDVATDSLFGPMWYRLLIGHAPLDENFAGQLVSQLFSGISTTR